MKKCIYYGDCDYSMSCEEDEPWSKCNRRTVVPEKFVLAAVLNMSIPSLNPDSMCDLRRVLNELARTRDIDFTA